MRVTINTVGFITKQGVDCNYLDEVEVTISERNENTIAVSCYAAFGSHNPLIIKKGDLNKILRMLD
jgi:hypothetical protein